MITTGIIKKINVSGGKHKNNKVIAEVSLFKSPGDINSDIYSCECNCSVPGGIYSPYNVGDKVYIGFLNGKKTNPIILGKIYQGLEDESRAFAYFSALKVRDEVNLPENTLLGDLKVADIKNLDKKIDNLNVIANRLPNPPIADGEYNLRCSVSGNEGTTINSKFISSTPDVKKSIRQSIQTKYGNSVVVNQWISNINFPSVESDFTNGVKVSAVDTTNLTITITVDTGGATEDRNFMLLSQYDLKLIASHKYLNIGCPAGGGADKYFFGISPQTQFGPDSGNGGILTNYSSGYGLSIWIRNGCPAGTYTFKPRFIDLTQWFGSNDNIPQDLLDNPSHFSWYYSSDLSYNTGTLINATGRYLECGQSKNLFNPATVTVGKYINIETGTETTASWASHSDYIMVIPNKPLYVRNVFGISSYYCAVYFDKDKRLVGADSIAGTSPASGILNVPSNAIFVIVNFVSTTDVNDIDVSLYYTPEQGGEGYDKYYPYIAPKVVDTGNEVLRSAGNIYDYKTPDGTIMRRVGRVDLGTLDWQYDDNKRFKSFILDSADTHIDYSTTLNNTLCPLYTASAEIWGNDIGNYILGISGHDLYIRNTSYTNATDFKNAMSGVILYYELATPTIEQGTSFQEDITINDYSYMLWKDDNDNLANIPQGCDIFYLQKEGGEIRYYWALVN